MPDESQLTSDLAEYFAITTAVPLPPAVARMSAETLRSRRRPFRALVLPAGALITGAAVVGIGFGLSHSTWRPSFSGSQGGGAGAPYMSIASPRPEAVGGAGNVVYPGVDGPLLESAGRTRLLSPVGSVTPTVSAATAQAAALAAAGSGAAVAGPAVLARVEDLSGAPVRCLCWVVDVPSNPAAPDSGPSRTVLVYIDASTGRYAGAHRGNGVP